MASANSANNVASYFGSPRFKDGTEGTAKVILNGIQDLPINGCIIQSDDNVKFFLNVASNNENTDFFVYFCSTSLPNDWNERLVEYKVEIHRFTKSKNDISHFTIAKNSAEIKGCHVFLPFKEEFKGNSSFPNFLTNYSKTFNGDHKINCSVKYKCLRSKDENSLPQFFHIDALSMCTSDNKTNNKQFVLRDGLFDVNSEAGKLVDGPILLGSTEKDHVVGWCGIASDRSKITLHKFKPEEGTVIIWKKSALEKLNETHDTVDTSTTGSSQLNTSPVLLKDLIQKNSCVEDCLKNGLDYKYRLLSNWRHLAGELKDPPVPPEIIEACKCNTIHSPTWEVLGRPDVSIKPVEELMKILRTGLYPRKDVCLELSNGIPEADRSKSIQDVLLNKVELMDKIATKLDAPATRVTKNWKYFAPRLGVQPHDIDLIERGNNPAESLLKHVYSTLPAEKKTAGEFRRIIKGFDNRPDLRTFVKDVLGIASNDDSRPLKSVIREESEEMKKVTALLNKSTGGVKNWKHLAVNLEIDYSVYNTFDPPSKPSPTGTLLEWVCNNSEISVEAFLNILGEIKRYDVKEKMEAEIIRKCN